MHDPAVAARTRLRDASTHARALPDGRTGLIVEPENPETYDPRADLEHLAVAYELATVRLPRTGWLPHSEAQFYRSDVNEPRLTP